MDDTPVYVIARSSNLAQKPSTKDSGSICKQNMQFFTLEQFQELIIILIFFLFIQISMQDM